MNRGSRVITPLIFAAVMNFLHWIAKNNPGLFADAAFPSRELTMKITEFLFLMAMIFAAVRALDFVAFDFLPRKRKVRAPVLLREIVSIVIFAVLFAWAFNRVFNTGFQTVTAFLATGTVVAAVLGLALQETLGNLFAGIALNVEDAFNVGDVVRTGEYHGIVEAIRWRGTHLRTFNNSIVIVPNSMLARDRLEVFPRNNLNARVLPINVDANVPPSVVIPILGQAAANVDGVSNQVPAFARVGSMVESWLVYEVKYHTLDYSQRDRIDSDIRKAAWYALHRNDIPLGTPVRTYARYSAPASKRQPDRGDIAQRLARVDILAPLSAAEHESIAAAANVHAFSKGETIIRQGHTGNSMFVVHSGVISVRVDDQEVARLGEGDFFGEMALLTGENRAADVVALTDVIAVEITKTALQSVLHADLVDAISAKVTERRGSIASLRHASDEEAHQTVLTRIRSYFGL
jgi:small-conductance mechanosensitive channel